MLPNLTIKDISKELSEDNSVTPYMKDSLEERFNLSLQKSVFGKGLLILTDEEKEELLKVFEKDDKNSSINIAFNFMKEKIPEFESIVKEEVEGLKKEAKAFYDTLYSVNTTVG